MQQQQRPPTTHKIVSIVGGEFCLKRRRVASLNELAE